MSISCNLYKFSCNPGNFFSSSLDWEVSNRFSFEMGFLLYLNFIGISIFVFWFEISLEIRRNIHILWKN